MSEEDQTVDVVVVPKFDMPSHESTMTAEKVKTLAIRHGIPLDLHPVALTAEWTMDQLSEELIGWKKRFFFLDRRAIPDAMAWRHHDSDVNDPMPEDEVTMSEYIRFPFLFGAAIEKGPPFAGQDRIVQHTTPLLSVDQPISDKTNHQKEDSANTFVHNYVDIQDDNEEANSLQLANQSGDLNTNTEVLMPKKASRPVLRLSICLNRLFTGGVV
ncbi:hypothetical protein Tco_0617868 [Tanacetum coccineum]